VIAAPAARVESLDPFALIETLGDWAGRRSERPGADAARPASTVEREELRDKMAVSAMSELA